MKKIWSNKSVYENTPEDSILIKGDDPIWVEDGFNERLPGTLSNTLTVEGKNFL